MVLVVRSSGAPESLGGAFRGCIAPDGFRQEGIGRRSDTRQTREFQLQPDPGVLGPGGRRGHWMRADEPAGPEARPPAARTVLEAGESLQRLAVLDGIDPPHEDVPGVADGPGSGDLRLVEDVTLVAVADIDDRLRGGLVLDIHLRALAALGLGIPLQAEVRAP